jgi:hypothetical protein
MRGDFSRIRFNPAKHYTAVLEQQGRVALDADGNERTAIDAYLRDTTNVDVIGPYGGPMGDCGFAIDVIDGEILILPGRYYVDGLLLEAFALQHYDLQPYLINPTYTAQQLLEAVIEGQGQDSAQLVLQVWQRLVTQLDDGCLREPALGQADTTARLQTVWRVIGTVPQSAPSQPVNPQPVPSAPTNININPISIGLRQPVLGLKQAAIGARSSKIDISAPGININPNLPSSGSNLPGSTTNPVVAGSTSGYADPVTQLSSCCQGLYSQQSPARTGAMGADTGEGNNQCGCQPIPSAGYQGLENQLYRVEIHTGGTLDTATFKWSRENGSIVAAIIAISDSVVTVNTLGPDANLGFQAGQWVELSDDTFLFGDTPNQPGDLYQIASLGPGPLQVTLATSVAGIHLDRHPRVRRWDQTGSGATGQGIALSSTAIPLENGIEVTFSKGAYQSGDYWTIPARTADGAIDWPPCGSDGQFFQPAKFTPIYTVPLACIHLRSANFAVNEEAFNPNSRFVVDDCRLQFPPLTALAQEQTSPALHVQSVTWTNDDVMTVDALIKNGLSVTFDQAPSCPWGGGNFRVTLEVPLQADPLVGFGGKLPGFPAPGNYPPGTDVFSRTELVLDPPLGITVSGAQVNWITPAATQGVAMYEAYYLYIGLNSALKSTSPIGFGRMRVRLLGGAVYADGAAGSIYLDGLSFGETGSRTVDGSPCVNLATPSGSSLKASDYESWFYLAPSVLIAGVAIQLLNGTAVVGTNAVTVTVNSQGTMTGLQVTSVPSAAATPVTAVQAVITMSYPPVTPTNVSLTLTGTGVGTVVTIQATATVSAGQLSVNVPINILASPGVTPGAGGLTDTVTLAASVAGLFSTVPFAGTAPTLAITGGLVPPPVIP